jgi:hypothetical protein
MALCALAGCASMSEQQCRATNWYQQGETDGMAGNQAKIDLYAHLCNQYQVQPAAKEYLSGWADGYAEFNKRVSGSKM